MRSIEILPKLPKSSLPQCLFPPAKIPTHQSAMPALDLEIPASLNKDLNMSSQFSLSKIFPPFLVYNASWIAPARLYS